MEMRKLSQLLARRQVLSFMSLWWSWAFQEERYEWKLTMKVELGRLHYWCWSKPTPSPRRRMFSGLGRIFLKMWIRSISRFKCLNGFLLHFNTNSIMVLSSLLSASCLLFFFFFTMLAFALCTPVTLISFFFLKHAKLESCFFTYYLFYSSSSSCLSYLFLFFQDLLEMPPLQKVFPWTLSYK